MSNTTNDTATVGVQIGSNWGSGFVAGITVTAEQAMNGWTLTFEFDGAIGNIWNAEIVSVVGNTYTVRSKSYNGNLAEGASASFGFVGRDGSTESITPISINGDDFGGGDPTLAVFSGNRDDYVVTQLDVDTIEVSGPEGVQIFTGVLTFEFADITQTAEEVVVSRLADLSVAAISADDVSLAPEQAAVITATIASTGVVDADASEAELVIASQPDAASITGTLGTVATGAITTGGTTEVSFDLSATDLAPGTYWVAVRADAGAAVIEEDEGNNLSNWVEITIEEPVADLILQDAVLGDRTDLDLTDGAAIEIEYFIEDASNYNASYLQAHTYLSTDAVISDDDLRVAGITGGTSPGLSTSPATIHYISEDYAPGDYYLISVLSWGGDVVDATPDDNVVIQQISLTPSDNFDIDLAVTGVTVANDAVVDLGTDGGNTLSLTVDLASLGLAAIDDANVFFFLSADGEVNSDAMFLGTVSATLAAGATGQFSFETVLGPDVALGDYAIIASAVVDGDLDLPNNIALADVTVIASPPAGLSEGDDIWTGTGIAQTVDMLGGNDIAIAGVAADMVDGGAGVDTIDLSALQEGAYMSVDDDANALLLKNANYNGPNSEWSNFEIVLGTNYDDEILGRNSSLREYYGGAGNDVIGGSSGSDILDGGSGDDLILCQEGSDYVVTGTGSDTIIFFATVEEFGPSDDVISDFDISQDIVRVLSMSNDVYDVDLDEDLVQTDAGAVLTYGPDSTALFMDIDANDLRNLISVEVFGFGV